ncbi:hypothetical protein [Cryptosporangium aurantiacum]|uniref:Uncharacterized protein n=1 Tax=Cryptosporangium aurantiacum TaxID=134849 RepID=A0A1M7RIM0_9ACTN|nr:hypothetical protein [Cryptosporangium aurantiacum]SHN46165.1 hypothetical protein SAMN05443668_1148 [Cryptosporangium aurantiacum]
MNDLDTALRSFYAERAEDAPSDTGLLPAVHRRARRDRRRRLLTGTAVVLVLALIGGAGVLALNTRDEAPQRLQVATPAGSSATAPPSPVDVGWLPDGFPEPTVRLLGPKAWGLDTRREKGHAALQVQIMAVRPQERAGGGTLSRVDVGGTPGSLYWVPTHRAGDPKWGSSPPEAEGPYAELIFERKPGQWIRIIVQNSAGDIDLELSKQDLVDIATALVDRSRPVGDVIRLGLLPGNVVWGQLANDEHGVTAGFVDADAPARRVSQQEQPNGHNENVDTQVNVTVYAANAPEIDFLYPPESAEDAAKFRRSGEAPPVPAEGWVVRREGRTLFTAPLAANPKFVVVVDVKDSFGMPVAEMRKVAASVELGPDAAVRPF